MNLQGMLKLNFIKKKTTVRKQLYSGYPFLRYNNIRQCDLLKLTNVIEV
jgi:hypothetical protein